MEFLLGLSVYGLFSLIYLIYAVAFRLFEMIGITNPFVIVFEYLKIGANYLLENIKSKIEEVIRYD